MSATAEVRTIHKAAGRRLDRLRLVSDAHMSNFRLISWHVAHVFYTCFRLLSASSPAERIQLSGCPLLLAL